MPRRGEQSESKAEPSPGMDAPEEAASNVVEETVLPKKRVADRSRITGLKDLPVETTEIIPGLVAADPDSFKRIGEETTELLDITPARFFRRLTVRPKFRRKTRRNFLPMVAPVPATPLVEGLPVPGLPAHLLVGKYFDHLPLYRQEKVFAHHRVGVPRNRLLFLAGSHVGWRWE